MEIVVKSPSRARISQQGVFLPASGLLWKASNMEELLNLLVRLLVEAVWPADAGILYLYDESCQRLVASASYGYHSNDTEHRISPNEGAVGRCYVLRKSLLFSSSRALEKQTVALKAETRDCYARVRQGLSPILSMVAIPLVLKEKSFGVVSLEHYQQHRPFKKADIPRIESLAGWVSLVIDDLRARLELKDTKRSYRNLLSRHMTAIEEERKEIAREIHDEVNQLLLSVKLNLENMESALPPDTSELRDMLEVSQKRINIVFDELHKLVRNLRPPALDDLGLAQALDYFVHSYSKEACLPITLQVSGLSQRRPAPTVELELFRIAQEALSNVVKHAHATSSRVKLNFGKSRLVLVVEDNGRGFDAGAILRMSSDKRNLGVLGMKERAKVCGGTLEIDSTPERGTCVKVDVPISSYDWGTY